MLVGTDCKSALSGGWNPLKNNIIFGHLINTMIKRLCANGQATAHKENGSDEYIHVENPRYF